jgi:hypothetical protein
MFTLLHTIIQFRHFYFSTFRPAKPPSFSFCEFALQGRLLRVLKLAKCGSLTGSAFERLLTSEATHHAAHGPKEKAENSWAQQNRRVDANGKIFKVSIHDVVDEAVLRYCI